MCGRFTQDVDEDDLIDLYELNPGADSVAVRSRWNGAPTQTFAVCLTDRRGERSIALRRWGLVPSWARDIKIGARLINARSETVDSKPSFRGAFSRRRCLVPANGWFEWKRDGAVKQPWWVRSGDGLLSFAGLWETWNRSGEAVNSFTVLTCAASESLKWLHHRQPVIIPRERHSEWLDPAAAKPALLALARTPHEGPFDWLRVSRVANSPRNDYPEILRPE